MKTLIFLFVTILMPALTWSQDHSNAPLTSNTIQASSNGKVLSGKEVLGAFVPVVSNMGYVYNGSWSPHDPNGNVNSTDNILIMSGTAIFDQNIEVNTITVNPGAKLIVEKVLTINGNIINNGTMVFKNTATANGELAAVPPGSSISGDITVETHISDNRAFRFLSSSVSTTTSIHANWQEGATSATDNPNPGFGTHITGSTIDQTNGFDATGTGNPSLFKLNVVGQQFTSVANTDSNTLNAGDAYLLFVRGNRSVDLTTNASHSSTVLRATGELFTGSKVENFGTVEAGKFVAVANPYQCAVNVNSVIGNSTNLDDQFIYTYDSTLGTNGAYATVLLPIGLGGSGSSANQFIQPGQAVQVAVATTGPVTINLAETDKAPGFHTATFSQTNPFVDNAHITGHLFTTINYEANASMHDSFSLLFNQDFDNALNNRDAVKPMNFTENMGIGTPTQAYSIERRALPNEGEDIALFNTNYGNQDYTLVMEVSDFDTTTPYLIDDFTGEQTELQAGENVVSFTVDQNVPESMVSNRFHIHFGPSTLSVGEHKTDYGIALYPNPAPSGSAFYVTAGQFEGQEVIVKITDLLGKMVYSATKHFSGGKIAIQPDRPLNSGVYFVKMVQDNKAVNKRLVVK